MHCFVSFPRILIRLLELELMQTSHKLSHEGIESIGREASNLLERQVSFGSAKGHITQPDAERFPSSSTCQDLGKDAGLSRFRAQYTAACHIWLMVLAQRRGGAEAARNVLHHATEINVLLRKMLAKATSVPRKVSSASSTLVKAAEKPVRKMVARAKPLKGKPPWVRACCG